MVTRFDPGGWGALPSIDVDPADRTRLVAGADVGGLLSSSDSGVSWSTCGGTGTGSRTSPGGVQIITAFILATRFVPLMPGPSLLLVGSSHGMYFGTASSDQNGSRGCGYTFELANAGLQPGNAALSMATDHEEFSHPISSLHHHSDAGTIAVFAGVGIGKSRGSARRRGGDRFSVYTATLAPRPPLAGHAPHWTGIMSFVGAVEVVSISSSARQLYVATDRKVPDILSLFHPRTDTPKTSQLSHSPY